MATISILGFTVNSSIRKASAEDDIYNYVNETIRTGVIKITPMFVIETDSNHWEMRNGRWIVATEEFRQMYYDSWILTNGKWYYVDKRGYMVANSWLVQENGNKYYVGSDGAWIPDMEYPY